MNKILKKIKIKEPVIYLVNYSSLTYIFIVLNFFQSHATSVQISIIQGLIGFIILGFSGDIRSIYLIKNSHNNVHRVILFRFFISLILCLVYVIFFRATDFIFILALIAKRSIDWVDEVVIHTSTAITNNTFKLRYLSVQLIFISILPFFYLAFHSFILLYFLCWCISNFLTIKSFYMEILIRREKNNKATIRSMEPHIFNTLINKQLVSTLFINSTNLFLRIFINLSFAISQSSAIISSMTIGGFLFSLFSNAYLPSFVKYTSEGNGRLKKNFNFLYLFLAFILFIIFCIFMPREFFYKYNLLPRYIIFSFIGGIILLFSNYIRLFLIQSKKSSTLNEDLVIHTLFSSALFVIYSYNKSSYFLFASLGLGLFSLLIYIIRFLSLKISILKFYIFFILYFLLICSSLLSFLFLIL